VLIGAPLGGSGNAELSAWGDSLLVISYSPAGDTILWLGAREGSAARQFVAPARRPCAGHGQSAHSVRSPTTIQPLGTLPLPRPLDARPSL
jgi:hypothetical protein